MEYILISLFGGGTADWQDITQTKYDWDKIIERGRYVYGFDLDINGLYGTILNIAIDELFDIVETYISTAKTKEEKEIAEKLEKIDFENDFDTWTNCLDTHLKFIGDEELGKLLQDTFEKEIDEIDKKIGFTYIDFDN